MSIEVMIAATPTGGLRLLPEINGTRPARLEGQNGIGKTATIRLLVLAAGGQPFASDEEAWKSLKANLGKATLTFHGITGTQEVVLILDPSLWPDTASQDIGDRLGVLLVDGTEKPASTLKTLLRIEHLTGTERLVDTLRRRVEEYGGALRSVRAPLDGLNGDLVEIARVADTLEFVSPASAQKDESARQEQQKLRESRATALTSLSTRVKALTRAEILQAMLSSAELDSKAAELGEAEKRRDLATAATEELEAQLERAIASLDEGTKAQRAIAVEERKLNNLKKTRNIQLAKLANLAGSHRVEGIDLLAELDDDQVVAVAAAANAAKDAYEALEAKYRQSLMTEAQRDLHNQLRVVLEIAVRRGLGQFVVARVGNQDTTVAQLAAAITAPIDPDAISTDEIQKARRTAEELQAIAEVHAARRAYERQLLTITNTLTKLRDSAPKQDQLQATVNSTKEARDAAESELLAQTQIIGRLRSQGLGKSEIAAARSDLEGLLASESVATNELSAALATASSEHSTLEAELASVRRALDEIEQRQALRLVTRQTLTAAIADGTTLDWIRGPGGLSLAETKDDETWWARAASRARHLAALTETLIGTVAGLAYASNSERSGELASVINSVVEVQAVNDFKDPAISEALFESGTPTSIDLKKRTISWETPDGTRREKPLSTFSSGQQALGFMRAQLRVLADDPSGDRIVFLDEFGAFISADRRHPLAELLKGEELAELAAQIIIVLPLQVDYLAQLPEVTGDLKAKYESRSAAIKSRGYFMESFDE